MWFASLRLFVIFIVFFSSTSYPVSMRCWGMSNRHGNPVPGQFSSWEEEEGGDHCGDQGLVSAQWHQREGGGLKHHLKRYASPLTAHSATVGSANIVLVFWNTPSYGEIDPLVSLPWSSLNMEPKTTRECDAAWRNHLAVIQVLFSPEIVSKISPINNNNFSKCMYPHSLNEDPASASYL